MTWLLLLFIFFDLAVVGRERVQQKTSTRLKFGISPLDKEDEFVIETHEIEKTIANVPALNRAWLKSFPHLRGVDFPHKAGPINLILGIQYSHLHAEEEVRQGLLFQPVRKAHTPRMARDWPRQPQKHIPDLFHQFRSENKHGKIL